VGRRRPSFRDPRGRSFADRPLPRAMIIETTVPIVVADMAADTIQARPDRG
jgi:hypothetical protein